jgi:hypothetical protein
VIHTGRIPGNSTTPAPSVRNVSPKVSSFPQPSDAIHLAVAPINQPRQNVVVAGTRPLICGQLRQQVTDRRRRRRAQRRAASLPTKEHPWKQSYDSVRRARDDATTYGTPL